MRKVSQDTVSIVYEYHTGGKKPPILHSIGNTSKIKKYYEYLIGVVKSKNSIQMKKVKSIESFYIDKMINMSGFIGLWHEAFVLNDAKAISKIYSIKKGTN